MQLSRLISGIPLQRYGMREAEVQSIEFDSRKVKPGALYVAIAGARYDGHDFVDDAENAGAVAVIVQRKVATDLPQIVVENPREVLAIIGARFYGEFDELTKIGVTGTNGKTTTTFLVHSILAQAGRRPGLIGTVYYLGATREKATRTTPELLDIYKIFKRFTEHSIDCAVMEVSSHALKLKRVEGIRFDVAVFTNISQDHLDFHVTMEDYLRSKLHLFSLLGSEGYAVYNRDDESSIMIEAMPLANKVSYGRNGGNDIDGRIIEQSLDGLRIEVRRGTEKFEVRSPLIGDFNLHNILAAISVGVALDVDTEMIIRGIEKMEKVPGRMECVVDRIFVDYAHTPAAVEKLLRAFRKYTSGKLIIVFGCGGDRDRDKRPKMGAVASSLADEVIVTSDNPRGEPPGQIIADILRGMPGNNHVVIEDRAAAIRRAITSRREKDIVIIAGKGHEEYQIVNDEVIEFSDSAEIRKCFANLR
ncbi:MAG: UDP-N-acetylmuramoyl-L-alanyl-D-glutamate--2,6-diaminopimelate ligase [candidate division WOR-3 bacterium]|nr:MAG: UDP-N-acetylmuramoyl-L-alanyl-D-glutamate--2,6-diaminopimelate ligase [candidate division WOR-3 bacterium]